MLMHSTKMLIHKLVLIFTMPGQFNNILSKAAIFENRVVELNKGEI